MKYLMNISTVFIAAILTSSNAVTSAGSIQKRRRTKIGKNKNKIVTHRDPSKMKSFKTTPPSKATLPPGTSPLSTSIDLSLMKEPKSIMPKDPNTLEPLESPSLYLSQAPEGTFPPSHPPSIQRPTSTTNVTVAVTHVVSLPPTTTNVPMDPRTREPSRSPTLHPSDASKTTEVPSHPPSIRIPMTNVPMDPPTHEPSRSPTLHPSDASKTTEVPSHPPSSRIPATIVPMDPPTREPFKSPTSTLHPSNASMATVTPSHPPSMHRPATNVSVDLMDPDASRSINWTESCYNSSTNVFGQMSKHPVILIYAYEMIYNRTFEVYDWILPALELTMTHALLDSSLVLGCQKDKRQSIHPNFGVVGVSSSPPDLINTKLCRADEKGDLEPTVGNYDGNVCNYIEGRLILYMSQGSTGDLEDQAANETLHIIKEGMDTDDFARAHEGINRLTFVEERWDDTVSEREQIDTNPSIDMTDSKTEKKLIPMYTWLCAASGGTLICFIIAVARRRWKRTNTERVVMD